MNHVTVRLETGTEERLRRKAAAEGLTLETYLAGLADREAGVARPPYPLADAMGRLTARTPGEVLADREAVLATARRARPLPDGRSLADVIEGTWPGDETDAEILRALDRLS